MGKCIWIFFVLAITLVFYACAGNAQTENEGTFDAPCSECGARGTLELEISEESFYREWNKNALERLDSFAVLGVFPSLILEAYAPENCSYCHSFSADAVDFDMSRVEDSVWNLALPNMRRELMFPGMRVPESDSLYVDLLLKSILQLEFADAMPLESMKPWISRDGIEQAFVRFVPPALRNTLFTFFEKYHVRYISIPIKISIRMEPNLGRKGGFVWESLFTLWDARYGELVFLTYNKFTASTTTRVAPEKEWANPMLVRLQKMFTLDFRKLEAH